MFGEMKSKTYNNCLNLTSPNGLGEVQLEAVKQDGCAIQYIKNPSEEVKQVAKH